MVIDPENVRSKLVEQWFPVASQNLQNVKLHENSKLELDKCVLDCDFEFDSIQFYPNGSGEAKKSDGS